MRNLRHSQWNVEHTSGGTIVLFQAGTYEHFREAYSKFYSQRISPRPKGKLPQHENQLVLTSASEVNSEGQETYLTENKTADPQWTTPLPQNPQTSHRSPQNRQTLGYQLSVPQLGLHAFTPDGKSVIPDR